ncbi:MAG: triose-phosphate isomerase [Victivallales bacterium]|nr:triose-phosphate isomerase [Victivallales bacterium]
MARRFLIAGNWKMNMTAAAGAQLIKDITAQFDCGCKCQNHAGGPEVLVCPPFTTIASVIEATKGTVIEVGAQNVHWAEKGAFTGEISGEMLKETGVTHVIIGHSERRQYFGETDKTVNQRVLAALANGLKVVLCVGETLEQRTAGITAEVIALQVKADLANVTAEQMANVVIAYEPVWAIGTGQVATDEQAEEVHAGIRALLAKTFSADVAAATRILYGGSMNAKNCGGLLAQPDIDGGLIGGAALKPADFATIIKTAKSTAK